MTTPRFNLNQTDDTVTVTVNVPYVRVSDMEFHLDHVDGKDFTFYCKPYLLRLRFPGAVIDDETTPAKAVYDHNVDHGTITITFQKMEKGLHFEDLDLLTTVLQQSRRRPGRFEASDTTKSSPPLIEVVKSVKFNDITGSPENFISSSNATNDTSDSTTLIDGISSISITTKGPRYGFNDSFGNGFFTTYHSDYPELTRVPNPDTLEATQRCILREMEENRTFTCSCDEWFSGRERSNIRHIHVFQSFILFYVHCFKSF
eukprot:GSMAST32.ASY1.ANO1.1477.1 assembled CDS